MRWCLVALALAGCARAAPPDRLPRGPKRVERPTVFDLPRPDEQAPLPSGLAAETLADIARVVDARDFALDAGFTGGPSVESTAVRAIADRPDGLLALEWLAGNARPGGQLHALVVLHELAPAKAAPHLERLLADDRAIVYGGNLASVTTVAELAAMIAGR
jgi:hypothetical protein